jgi:hypothetical protein
MMAKMPYSKNLQEMYKNHTTLSESGYTEAITTTGGLLVEFAGKLAPDKHS